MPEPTIVAAEVHQVVTFENGRSPSEIEAWRASVMAAMCGPGHTETDDECDNDVSIGGSFRLHYAEDEDASDWQ